MSKIAFFSFYSQAVDEPMQMKVSQRLFSPTEGRKDHFMSAEEGVARLRKGLFAFIMEERPMYKLIEDTLSISHRPTFKQSV